MRMKLASLVWACLANILLASASMGSDQASIYISSQGSQNELRNALKDKSATKLKLDCYSNSRNEHLINENIRILSTLLKDSNINTLEITGHHIHGGIGDKNVALLASALKGTKVTKLDLSLYNLGSEGAAALGKALSGTALTDLSLSLNNITVPGTIKLAQDLQKSNVTSLRIVVDLNEFDSDSAIKLGTALKDTKIKNLFLDLGGLNSDAIEANASKLHNILKDLKLAELQFWLSSSNHNQTPNGISSNGAIMLGKALKDLCFPIIRFQNNYLSKEGVAMLTQELKGIKCSEIDFSNNPATEDER